MLETRKARGLVLAVLAAGVVVALVGLNRYSAPRADAEVARVVEVLTETLEGYDTATEFQMATRSGSFPDVPASTSIGSEGQGLVARTTVREVTASRCVRVTAQPVQPDGPLQVEDATIVAGSC